MDHRTLDGAETDEAWSNVEFRQRLGELITAPSGTGGQVRLVTPTLRTVQGWRAGSNLSQTKYLEIILEALFGPQWKQSAAAQQMEQNHKLAMRAEPLARSSHGARGHVVNADVGRFSERAGWAARTDHNTVRLVEMTVHTPAPPNDPDVAPLRVSVSLGEDTSDVDGCTLRFRLQEPYVTARYIGCEPEPGTRLGEPAAGTGSEITAAPLSEQILFRGGAWNVPTYDPESAATASALVDCTLVMVRANRSTADVTVELCSSAPHLDVTVVSGSKKVDALRRRLIGVFLSKDVAGSNPGTPVWARSTLLRRSG
jgi:hypothetical protein